MKRPAARPAPPPPKKEVFDVEQGSEDWHKLRLGVPTASHFGDILAQGEGKMRRTYLYNLAGERVSGLPAEDFVNEYMNRGRRMEPQARASYEMTHDVEVAIVGFVKRGRVGASPDGEIGTAGGVEFKSVTPKLLIPRILTNSPPPSEHLPQCHGEIWVCEWEWCDLSLFWPGFPEVIFRIHREEDYIRWMADQVDRFCDELEALVRRLNGDPEKLVREMEIPR